jgi:hypothetical protein
MGKVTYKELPKDHPIFKAGWLISTVRNQSQKIKQYEELKIASELKTVRRYKVKHLIFIVF